MGGPFGGGEAHRGDGDGAQFNVTGEGDNSQRPWVNLIEYFGEKDKLLSTQTIYSSPVEGVPFELQLHRIKLQSGEEISVLFYDLSRIEWERDNLNTSGVFQQVAAAANVLDSVLEGVPVNKNLDKLSIEIRESTEQARLKLTNFSKIPKGEPVYSIFNFVDVTELEKTRSAAPFVSMIAKNLKAFSKDVTERLEYTLLIGEPGGFLPSIAIKWAKDTQTQSSLLQAITLIREGKVKKTVPVKEDEDKRDTEGRKKRGN